MGEPRAITYKEVRKAFKTDAETREAWSDINAITGAHAPAQEHYSIDLTEASDSQRERIDKILNPSAKETPKGGSK